MITRKVRFLLAMSFATYGCSPETLDDCLVAAAKEARSVAALEILKADCEKNHKKEKFKAKDIGKLYDQINLNSYVDGAFGSSYFVRRSSIKHDRDLVSASVRQKVRLGNYDKFSFLFYDPSQYKDQSDDLVYAILTGQKEYDCAARRSRWLSPQLEIFVGGGGIVGPIPIPQENTDKILASVGGWKYASVNTQRDILYICEGRLKSDAAATGYGVCGADYSSPCTEDYIENVEPTADP